MVLLFFIIAVTRRDGGGTENVWPRSFNIFSYAKIYSYNDFII